MQNISNQNKTSYNWPHHHVGIRVWPAINQLQKHEQGVWRIILYVKQAKVVLHTHVYDELVKEHQQDYHEKQPTEQIDNTNNYAGQLQWPVITRGIA